MAEKATIKSRNPETKNPVYKTQKTKLAQTTSSPIDHIFHLHRTIGNQAVQRLMKHSGVMSQESGVKIQTKLTIGQHNNSYERGVEGIAKLMFPMIQRVPSRIIPDLENRTVSEMSSLLPNAVSVPLRQQLVDMIVADRRGKGTDFSIMERGFPVYVSSFPSELLRQGLSPNANGVTVPANSPPVNTGSRPLVLIGPMAFGTSRDPLNERLVRIYSTIMHEYQHVLQWQHPSQARAMGRHRREVEAFFWEIENSRRTGLFWQRGPFRHTWDEAVSHWRAFVNSSDWNSLSIPERARYARWYERVSQVVIAALGPEVILPTR